MKKVLIIVGPTGVGKTDLSIELAKRFNAEIISGDSVQIYKGLDIGSAKITEEEKQGIKHYGIDELSFLDNYSVYDFQKMSRFNIEEICKKNKLPMIVGGTGLYIKSCIYDYEFVMHEPVEFLDMDDKTNEELYEELKKLDEFSANKIHINNRKRIIRALTLCRLGTSKTENENNQQHKLIYDAFIVGCTVDRALLYERINNRVLKMIDSGLEQEIKGLLENGLTFENQSMQAIGYKEWKDYFLNNISKEEVISLIQKNSRNFAKRQYTWFNNQMDVNWVNMLDKEEVNNIIDRIEKWIKD